MRSINLPRSCFLLLALLTAVARGQDAPPPSPYAGSEVCGTCHTDIATAFAKTAHHLADGKDRKRGFDGKACESCHGPGAKHAGSADPADIRNPGKLGAAAIDKICLACHVNQPTQTGRLQSSHAKDLVACTTCHTIHATGTEVLVVRKTEAINKQCEGCHLTVAAQFQQPFHHKLPEGAMSCVDCHNPHGSMKQGMMQSFGANEPGCLHCHGDKRGPFPFEHGPVRFEGCSTCHAAHGSANPRMLDRPQVQQLCLECHANLPVNMTGTLGVVPPAFHDLRSPRFQNCTVCHQKIHGSYVDRNLLK
ncbi:MAG: DmsE family decaheme c-type cytochrome [Bryobacteraceae bacterium]